MNIPDTVSFILNRLEERGFEAYAVGGCVRDSLLAREPNDWDVCTAALPQQVEASFPDVPVIGTGLRHGTVTLLLGHIPYEVTTFRKDGEYSDHRRPDQVAFVQNLTEDLSRRDFTVNAMAYSPRRGLVDAFGGLRDLRAGILRCVGDPEWRFQEDALRILRALRFSSVYGFRLEEETARAVREGRERLAAIAPERIREELCRMLLGKGAEEVLNGYPEVLAVFLPEIIPTVGFAQNHPHHDRDVWGHTARAVGCSKRELPVRLALLLHDLGKPLCYREDAEGTGHFYGHAAKSAELAGKILCRLRFDKAVASRVQRLAAEHDAPILAERRNLRRWLNRLGEEALRQLIEVRRGDVRGQSPAVQEKGLRELSAAEECLRRLLKEEQCFQLRDLAVNGRDLIGQGVPEGAEIGRLLRQLLEQVLEGELPNERDALLKAAKRLWDG